MRESVSDIKYLIHNNRSCQSPVAPEETRGGLDPAAQITPIDPVSYEASTPVFGYSSIGII